MVGERYFCGEQGQDVWVWIRHVEAEMCYLEIEDDEQRASYAYQGLEGEAYDMYCMLVDDVQQSWSTLKFVLALKFWRLPSLAKGDGYAESFYAMYKETRVELLQWLTRPSLDISYEQMLEGDGIYDGDVSSLDGSDSGSLNYRDAIIHGVDANDGCDMMFLESNAGTCNHATSTYVATYGDDSMLGTENGEEVCNSIGMSSNLGNISNVCMDFAFQACDIEATNACDVEIDESEYHDDAICDTQLSVDQPLALDKERECSIDMPAICDEFIENGMYADESNEHDWGFDDPEIDMDKEMQVYVHRALLRVKNFAKEEHVYEVVEEDNNLKGVASQLKVTEIISVDLFDVLETAIDAKSLNVLSCYPCVLGKTSVVLDSLWMVSSCPFDPGGLKAMSFLGVSARSFPFDRGKLLESLHFL